MKYKSKYPKIIIDTEKTTHFNNRLNYNITIEEFYDLMHHTHSIADLTAVDGEVVDDNIQATVLNLVATVNELKQTIANQQNTINELVIKNNEQYQTINQLSQQVKINKDNITDITEGSDDIYDWDVTKEGIQDVDGNTIG